MHFFLDTCARRFYTCTNAARVLTGADFKYLEKSSWQKPRRNLRRRLRPPRRRRLPKRSSFFAFVKGERATVPLFAFGGDQHGPRALSVLTGNQARPRLLSRPAGIASWRAAGAFSSENVKLPMPGSSPRRGSCPSHPTKQTLRLDPGRISRPSAGDLPRP